MRALLVKKKSCILDIILQGPYNTSNVIEEFFKKFLDLKEVRI
ncbi:hypothetical protein DOT_0012 [Desulfosporosinus sp. OT]|nr:hypothetical protein DOT_0012 [Desulfosporosinus sp. OT]